jgi:hypothetical protein
MTRAPNEALRACILLCFECRQRQRATATRVDAQQH